MRRRLIVLTWPDDREYRSVVPDQLPCSIARYDDDVPATTRANDAEECARRILRPLMVNDDWLRLAATIKTIVNVEQHRDAIRSAMLKMELQARGLIE